MKLTKIKAYSKIKLKNTVHVNIIQCCVVYTLCIDSNGRTCYITNT